MLRAKTFKFSADFECEETDAFTLQDQFGFSVQLDPRLSSPMFIQMVLFSCDTLELQVRVCGIARALALLTIRLGAGPQLERRRGDGAREFSRTHIRRLTAGKEGWDSNLHVRS